MTRYRLEMLGVALTLLSVACSPAQPVRPLETGTPAVATSGPSLFEAQYAAAASAITLFHVRLDQRNYRGIYGMTDDTFRATTNEVQMTAMLSSLRERLGRSLSLDERSFEAVDRSPDVQITFEIGTAFEYGTLIETFVWRVTPSETVYLVSYRTR